MHLDQRVAGGAAAEARAALAAQPQDLTVLDPRRYCHIEPFFGSQSQALLAAGRRFDKIDGQGEEPVAAARPEFAAPRPAAPSRGAKRREQVLQVTQIHFAFGLVFAASGTL